MTTKIPVELSSTPGITDNSNATAITIDSSENTTFTTGTNDSVKITGAENSAYIDSSKIADVATKGIFIALSRPEDGNITVNGIGTYDASGKNNLAITSRSDIVFAGNDGEMGRFLLAGGLTFNGDTAAANALDDYEEGTWTPTFVNFGTGTYTYRLGIYTKIGNLVTVQCHLDVSDPGNASGDIQVSGFPFAALNSSNMYGVSSSVHGTSWSTQRTSLNLLLSPNATSTTSLFYGMCIGTPTTVSHADLGNGNLLFSVTYRTT